MPGAARRPCPAALIPRRFAHESVKQRENARRRIRSRNPPALQNERNPPTKFVERARECHATSTARIVVAAGKGEKQRHENPRLGRIRAQDRPVGSPSRGRAQRFQERQGR